MARRIVIAAVVLGLSGMGLLYYACRVEELTFHPDWTEEDRLQIREIMSFLEREGDQKSGLRKKSISDRLISFPLSDSSEWRKHFGYIYKDWQEYIFRKDDYYWKKMVSYTAKTGNASHVGKYGWTLLHFACAYGKKDLAFHLMERGADVNIRTKDKGGSLKMPSLSPFHFLITGGLDSSHRLDTETVMCLMEKLALHGADLNIAMGAIYPLELLCFQDRGYSREEQERMILKWMDLGVDVVSPFESIEFRRSSLMHPVKRGFCRVVRRLCERGVDVNKGYDTPPALFYVNPFENPENQVEIAGILLDYGAQINGPDPSGNYDKELIDRTPLARLCSDTVFCDFNEKEKRCLLDLVAFYIKRNADVNLVFGEGMSPLMYLFKREDMKKDLNLRLELARQLLSNGADPSLKNSEGETVLDMIKDFSDGEKEILEKLPELKAVK